MLGSDPDRKIDPKPGPDGLKMLEQYGPYGSQLPENYRMQLEDGEFIKELKVGHGYIVDALEVLVATPDGSTDIYHFGGDQGDENKRCSQPPNLNPNGYGPFGQGRDITNVSTFSSPDKSDGYVVVGFFGRSNNYLESVGVSIQKIQG
ncbi:uncharacterized protein [Spinacia oleracea]|uniref:Uncharacterized protein isoform X2 n=1 Tax=Spinacia oleracea TaxID=3562 RepID=A0ABM3R0N9_SPIOL|nr:uncharacterized protein LOC110801348 isoform X2 [Spinacia oleracea]